MLQGETDLEDFLEKYCRMILKNVRKLHLPEEREGKVEQAWFQVSRFVLNRTVMDKRPEINLNIPNLLLITPPNFLEVVMADLDLFERKFRQREEYEVCQNIQSFRGLINEQRKRKVSKGKEKPNFDLLPLRRLRLFELLAGPRLKTGPTRTVTQQHL
jgi:hypothetical protein